MTTVSHETIVSRATSLLGAANLQSVSKATQINDINNAISNNQSTNPLLTRTVSKKDRAASSSALSSSFTLQQQQQQTQQQQSNIRYENTYRIEPLKSQLTFSPRQVESLLYGMLDKHLSNVAYEPSKCKELTKFLCEEAKCCMKQIVYKRYKLVVNVSIVSLSLHSSGFLQASRVLLNASTDNFCSVSYKNSSLTAIVTVFAVYCE